MTLNLGHTELIRVFLSSNVVLNWFLVELSRFEANIEGKKEVEHKMSTLLLQLTQVLMSQIVGMCVVQTCEQLEAVIPLPLSSQEPRLEAFAL